MYMYMYTYAQVIRAAEVHVNLARNERSHYRTLCKDSKSILKETFTQEGTFNPPPPHSSLPPLSNPITVHYSFDMAQQVCVEVPTHTELSELSCVL